LAPKPQVGTQQVVISLNEKLYANAKAIFEQRSQTLLDAYSGPFVEDIVKHLQSSQTNYNIQKKPGEQSGLFFHGYPSGNFLKQVRAFNLLLKVCVVIGVWKQTEKFPIEFKGMPGFESHDVTSKQIEALNLLTSLVQSIFKEISALPGKSPRAL